MYLLVFHAYINEMHGSRSKFPSKNFVRQLYAEGYNSGIRGLNRSAFGGKVRLENTCPQQGRSDSV
jgi:hypothetical protein